MGNILVNLQDTVLGEKASLQRLHTRASIYLFDRLVEDEITVMGSKSVVAKDSGLGEGLGIKG